MDNLFSVIDAARVGLMAEKAKVEVFASNIANVHNSKYTPKEVNFKKLIDAMESVENTGYLDEAGSTIETELIVDLKPGATINLDDEVAGMTEAELRYQAIAQLMQKKMGLIDLLIGGKNK